VENIIGFVKQAIAFSNSPAFNRFCKLVYYFMTALAIALGAGFANGMGVTELRGML
jgi:hypothetical protein